MLLTLSVKPNQYVCVPCSGISDPPMRIFSIANQVSIARIFGGMARFQVIRPRTAVIQHTEYLGTGSSIG